MPLVRLTCTAAGRYEASRGDVITITDEEYARWAPEGLVEAVDGDVAAGPVVATVEAPEAADAADAPAGDVTEAAPVERPKRRSTRTPKAS